MRFPRRAITRRYLAVLAAGLLSFALPSPARAAVPSQATPVVLYTVANSHAVDAVTVDATGSPRINQLAAFPASFVLGVIFDHHGSLVVGAVDPNTLNYSLTTLDAHTGTVQKVQPVAHAPGLLGNVGLGQQYALDPQADALYTLVANDGLHGPQLVRVSLTDGAITPMTLAVGASFIAITPDGRLFARGAGLYELDRLTGAVLRTFDPATITPPGSTSFGYGLSYDPASKHLLAGMYNPVSSDQMGVFDIGTSAAPTLQLAQTVRGVTPRFFSADGKGGVWSFDASSLSYIDLNAGSTTVVNGYGGPIGFGQPAPLVGPGSPVIPDTTPPISTVTATSGNAGLGRLDIASATVSPGGATGTATCFLGSGLTATIHATDPGATASGVAQVSYQLDSAPPVTTSGDTAAVTVTTIGLHTLAFHATDRAGNVEQTQTVSLVVSPATSCAGTFTPAPLPVHGTLRVVGTLTAGGLTQPFSGTLAW